MSVFKRTSRLLLAATVSVTVFAVAVSAASASVIYNNIPSPLPGNLASFGNEAYSMAEFGGMVEFASPGQKHQTVTVGMSTWACQFGSVYPNTCETPKPQKKFKWPLTLNVYEVGPGNSVGAKLATVTKTFSMPYRPTRDTTGTCVGKGSEAGTWYDATTNACYHGMAFPITFKRLHLETRKKEIISVCLQHQRLRCCTGGTRRLQLDGRRVLLRLAEHRDHRTGGRRADSRQRPDQRAVRQHHIHRDVLRQLDTRRYLWPDGADRRIVRDGQPVRNRTGNPAGSVGLR